MGQELLQSRAALHYYKVGEQLLQSWAGNLLQSGAVIITKWADITKRDKFITKWVKHYYNLGVALRYYKVRQELLQSWADNLLQSWALVITKWGRQFIKKQGNRYYKMGQVLKGGSITITN